MDEDSRPAWSAGFLRTYDTCILCCLWQIKGNGSEEALRALSVGLGAVTVGAEYKVDLCTVFHRTSGLVCYIKRKSHCLNIMNNILYIYI